MLQKYATFIKSIDIVLLLALLVLVKPLKHAVIQWESHVGREVSVMKDSMLTFEDNV